MSAIFVPNASWDKYPIPGEKVYRLQDMCLMDINYPREGADGRKNLYNCKKPSIQKTPNGLVFCPNCGINAFFLNH